MTQQPASSSLSPQLRAVLGSLTISLEAELNRYRRNCFKSGSASGDLFADLEDAAFDRDSVELPVTVPYMAAPVPLPALPPNRRLLAAQAASADLSAPIVKDETPQVAITSAALSGSLVKALSGSADGQGLIENGGATIASGYMVSSEKLIESLIEVPDLPEPVNPAIKPNRQTVSLLAGAVLGFFGLIAGLSASYLMSNPAVAQQLADRLQGHELAIATTSQLAFDPPGPDLSASEFVSLDLANLSSLKMPQTAVDPQSLPIGPSATTALPPIASESTGANTPGLNSASAEQSASGLQALAIPAGVTYYVTVPFTTEQGLLEIRKAVDAAFVRQFADGNRIQLAAFNNPESAQQFIKDIKARGIDAQVYGPTAE
ncbi:SPOR domain-containing protein [Leptolyngbya sp. BC1307]|uniref:SPOR domain-containing protein n=1 Tax=Leptolyngbya sp. BC1307 TaxID=2029589 RepID=UPI000EFA78A5|nr:SPOR domain-containing protein [Leptolyngbya sp. BC1307]